jgi:hypothetical protein
MSKALAGFKQHDDAREHLTQVSVLKRASIDDDQPRRLGDVEASRRSSHLISPQSFSRNSLSCVVTRAFGVSLLNDRRKEFAL